MAPVALALAALLLQQPVPASASPELLFDEPLLRQLDGPGQRGLAWLAARQQPSGCWSGLVGHKQESDYVPLINSLSPAEQVQQGRGHMGITALCGMAFLAGGHLPDRGPYRKTVQATLDYMLAHVHENGYLSDAGTRMYSHAFATLFLAEIYGMSGGKETKQALERAVNLIVDCQNEHGGWRYNAFDRELDLSVTVCQLQALRAARNIGIQVPSGTIDRAVDYVQKSRVRAGRSKGQFYYKIYGRRGAYEKPNEYAINAAALTALASAGIYDPDLHDPALDFLEQEYGYVARDPEHYFFWYGNYYACQAFYQRGGERFGRFYAQLTKDILACQQADGSWQNRTGPGDEFSTAMACVILQLPKQYLPIFQR